MKTKKGFTLIELLVVVAIIGILASVVLASLNSARDKANDAKIKSQLKSMLAQAQLYTGTNVANTPLTTPIVVSSVVGNTGSDLFTDSTIADNSLLNLIKGLPSGTRVSYGSDAVSPNDGGKWIILAQSPKGGWTCVDYTGMFKSYGNTDKGAIEMDGGFSWFTCGS